MKHMIDLKDYEKKMDELSWMILDAIGTKGHSTYLDIEADITEKDATYTQEKYEVQLRFFPVWELLTRK